MAKLFPDMPPLVSKDRLHFILAAESPPFQKVSLP